MTEFQENEGVINWEIHYGYNQNLNETIVRIEFEGSKKFQNMIEEKQSIMVDLFCVDTQQALDLHPDFINLVNTRRKLLRDTIEQELNIVLNPISFPENPVEETYSGSRGEWARQIFKAKLKAEHYSCLKIPCKDLESKWAELIQPFLPKHRVTCQKPAVFQLSYADTDEFIRNMLTLEVMS